MRPVTEFKDRLDFLSRVVQRVARDLLETDARLFAVPLTGVSLARLAQDCVHAEQLEAFVSRFGRLQDLIGDKLLPALLMATAEPTGTTIDNLDRAEKLGWLDSVDDWLVIRKLRNQMVHTYIEDLDILGDALTAGHQFVPTLVDTANRLCEQVRARIAGDRI